MGAALSLAKFEFLPRIQRHLEPFDRTLLEADQLARTGLSPGLARSSRLLRGRPFAVPILSANIWPVIEPHVAKIAQALDECEADTVTKVDCGKFIPGRFRKTAAPSS
jgi:hypothetical protein